MTWLNPILWPPDAKTWLTGKDPDAGKDWRQDEKGTTENEMAGWHHRLNGHGFEQSLGVGDGQGGLGCYSPWGCKESDTTEPRNWPEEWLTRVIRMHYKQKSLLSDTGFSPVLHCNLPGLYHIKVFAITDLRNNMASHTLLLPTFLSTGKFKLTGMFAKWITDVHRHPRAGCQGASP